MQSHTHRTGESIDQDWSQIWHHGIFDDQPVTIASIQTYNGQDTADVRIDDSTKNSLNIKIEEEESEDPDVTHNAESVGLFSIGEGLIRDTHGNQIGEAHTTRINQSSPSEWHTIDLLGDYDRPVVFAQVLSYEGPEPCHTRMNNIGSKNFDLKIEEWEEYDETHSEETVGYVVLEEDRHQLDNGMVVDVGTTQLDLEYGDVWHSVDVPNEWGPETTVITRCQTYNGPNSVVTRQQPSVSTRPGDDWGFDVRLQEQEKHEQIHNQERVGYLLAGTALRTDAGLTGESVTEDWHWVSTKSRFAEAPVTLTSMQTFNGSDPASVRVHNVSQSGFRVQIEEPYGPNSPNVHGNPEVVGYFAVDINHLPIALIEDTDGNDIGLAGKAEIGAIDDGYERISVPVDKFSDPVAFAQVMSDNGAQPCHTRISWENNRSRVNFEIEEWEGYDQDHTDETIGYVILEGGTASGGRTHQLDDGTLVHVNTVETDHNWESANFPEEINANPADYEPSIITRCQTKRGGDPVETRQTRDIQAAANSFKLRLQEEEHPSVQGGESEHVVEQIGYLVAGQPLRVDSGQTDQSMDHNFSDVWFGSGTVFPDRPVTLASIQTYNGNHPADVRIQNPSKYGFEAKIEEENSDGSGTDHTYPETVGYLAIEKGLIRDTNGTLIGEADTLEFGLESDVGETASFHGDFDHSELSVFGQVMTYNGGDPCHVRPISWLGAPTDALYVKIEEWNYLDSWHTEETVGYVALEDGVHQLDDGTVLEVGNWWIDDEWDEVDITANVNADPIVITQSAEVMDDTPVVTRHRNVTRDSFEVRFQEEKAEDGDHQEEKIAYLVVG